MTKTGTPRVLELAAHQPLVRPRDVEARGIAREPLLHLYRQGLLVRAARGVCALADAPACEHHSLAVAAKRVSRGVICLLSALRSCGLTTHDPHEVWNAIARRSFSHLQEYLRCWRIWSRGPRREAPGLSTRCSARQSVVDEGTGRVQSVLAGEAFPERLVTRQARHGPQEVLVDVESKLRDTRSDASLCLTVRGRAVEYLSIDAADLVVVHCVEGDFETEALVGHTKLQSRTLPRSAQRALLKANLERATWAHGKLQAALKTPFAQLAHSNQGSTRKQTRKEQPGRQTKDCLPR